MTGDRSHRDEELARLERKVATAPHGHRYVVELADAYADLGRWQEAVETYEDAIRLYPDDALLFNDLAIACEEAGRMEQAEKYYKQALVLQPRLSTAHLNLGLLYKEQDRISASIRHLELCVEFTSDSYEIETARVELKTLKARDVKQLQGDYGEGGLPDQKGLGSDQWVQVAKTVEIIEAELIAELLRLESIPATVLREGGWDTVAPSFGSSAAGRVLVPKPFLEKAQHLLQADVNLDWDEEEELYSFDQATRSYDESNAQIGVGSEYIQGDAIEDAEGTGPDYLLQELASRVGAESKWFLGWGVVNVVFSGLSAPFGLLLIAVGLASHYFRVAAMFVVFGVVWAWAVVSNLLVGGPVALVFAVIQLPLCVRAFGQFRRYHKSELDVYGPDERPAGTAATMLGRAQRIFPWGGFLFGASSLAGLLGFFVLSMFWSVMSSPQEGSALLAFAFGVLSGLGILGLALGLASLFSGFRFKIVSSLGVLSGCATLFIQLALVIGGRS